MAQTISLTEMQKVASEKQASIEKMEGDWRQQIDELNAIVTEVKTWQKKVFAKFGIPNVSSAPPTTRITNTEDLGELRVRLNAMQNLGFRFARMELPPAQDNGFLVPYTDFKASFTGATIVQGMQVMQLEQHAEIQYKAMLKTDENYFLSQMLPETQVQDEDPDYVLYDFKITVPRAELVKESLHLLSERLNEPIKKERLNRRIKLHLSLSEDAKIPLLLADALVSILGLGIGLAFAISGNFTVGLPLQVGGVIGIWAFKHYAR